MIYQNMQLINSFTELLSRHKTKVPSFCKVAFKRINETRVNAHMTLQHNKNWVNYYLVLIKEFAVSSTNFVSEKTEISVIFPV